MPRSRDMILVVDNYDSFTWNLVHYLAELGAETRVVRNDDLTTAEAWALKPEAVLLSPGPCTPNEAGICLALLDSAPLDMPIFGVCLGHQAMGQAFGGDVIRAKALMHGKTSPIEHGGESVFRGLPSPFQATRYHSLVVDRATLPAELEVTAWLDDGTIMGLRHKHHLIEGVQFHPESIASAHGHQPLRNFLDEAKARVPA